MHRVEPGNHSLESLKASQQQQQELPQVVKTKVALDTFSAVNPRKPTVIVARAHVHNMHVDVTSCI